VKRNYEEGAMVKKGQVLFEIDPRPFEAALAQAKANLGQAQAQLGKTERDLARDKPLADQHAIAQSQMDDDVQANLAAKATVTALEAAVDTAQLNLGFTKVTSLIDGVAAIATAQIGDLVGPQTLLTTVSQINPIKAYFPLGEREYLDLAARINHRNGGSGGAPWRADAGLTLVLSNGTTYPHKGTFLAADRAIDPKTGTIRISATFPNPDGMLRPGQYGHVRAETALRDNALLVPQRAVTELQGVYQVRVVNADNTVTTKAVTPGARVGSRWIIESGLQPDMRVVVEGPATKDGTTVAPKPYVEPAGR
jgi:membrane fusion protein (multidrug efflux system)